MTTGDGTDLGLEPWVRDLLRCPACGSTLTTVARPGAAPELVCTGPACALAYPVRDGIPVLLLDEAHPATGTA